MPKNTAKKTKTRTLRDLIPSQRRSRPQGSGSGDRGELALRILGPVALCLILMLLVCLPRYLSFRAGSGVTSNEFLRPSTPDAFYYIRMTNYFLGEDENLVRMPARDGSGTELVDLLRYAPEGQVTDTGALFLSQFSAFLIRILRIFAPGKDLYWFIYLFTIIFPAFAVPPLLLMLRAMMKDLKWTKGFLPAALVAGVLPLVSNSALTRCAPGYFDTDLLIPALSAWVLYFSYLLLSGRSRFLSGLGLAVSGGLFARLWDGHVFFLAVVCGIALAAVIGCVMGELIRRRAAAKAQAAESPTASGGSSSVASSAGSSDHDPVRSSRRSSGVKGALRRFWFHGKTPRWGMRDRFASAALLPLFILLGVLVFAGPTRFASLLRSALKIFRLRTASSNIAGQSWFPSARISVKEMAAPKLFHKSFIGVLRCSGDSASTVLGNMGGIIAFILGLALIIWLVVRVIRRRLAYDDLLPLLFLSLWWIAAVLAGLQGLHYLMLVSFPAAMAGALLVAGCVGAVQDHGRIDRAVVPALLLACLLLPTLLNNVEFARKDRGSVISPDMIAAGETLRTATPEDTVVVSWWDYGYFYSIEGDRAVLFDGGTQSGIRLYWVGRALTTEDRKLAINILHMLSGTGDAATKALMEITGDGGEATRILLGVLSRDKAEAVSYLTAEEGLAADKAQEITDLAHPENYRPIALILSSDMLKKFYWMANFGYWDGDKPSEYPRLTRHLDRFSGGHLKDGDNRLNLSQEKGDDLQLVVTRQMREDGVPLISAVCYKRDSNGNLVETETPYRFRRIYYRINDGRNYMYEPEDSGSGTLCDLVLNETQGRTRIVFLSPALSDSLFGELYYRGRAWQSDFTRLDNEEALGTGGTTCQIWYTTSQSEP